MVNQNDPIYANFAIPSPQFMRLRALQAQGRLKSDGTVAEITLADGTVYRTKGAITFIDKQVNTNTSVVAARAEFVNPDLFVLPGQFVRVTLSGMELVNAILIPQQAVIQTQKGSMVVVFKNGKAARFSMESFETKTNRRRLTGAYSDKAPAVAFFHPIEEESEITMFSTANRALTFRASMLDVKASRSTQGVQTMVLRGKHTITRACRTEDAALSDNARYRCRSIPSIGALLTDEDLPDKQLKLL